MLQYLRFTYTDYDRLWSHKKLNDATHSNLSKFLGGTTMKSLQHLMFMGTHGYVTDNSNKSLVTDDNMQRLASLPILFIHGSDNVVYSPESTDKSFTKLTTTFQQEGYEYEAFEGYGHLDCWMGKDAAQDIYPRVLAHARNCMKLQTSNGR